MHQILYARYKFYQYLRSLGTAWLFPLVVDDVVDCNHSRNPEVLATTWCNEVAADNLPILFLLHEQISVWVARSLLLICPSGVPVCSSGDRVVT